jgi:chitin synthase
MKGVPKSTSKDSDKKSSFEEVKQTVSALISCLEKTRKWNVYCINPLNEKKEYSMKLVEDQLVLLNIRELVALKSIFDVDIDSGISYDNFINKYGPLVSTLGATKGGATSIDATNAFISKQYWPSRDFFCGTHSLFLSIQKWRWLDSALARFNEQSLGPRESGNFMNFTAENTFLRDDDQYSEPESLNESEYRFKTDEAVISNKQKDIESGNKAVLPVHEHIEVSEDLTGSRKCWICCAWTLTWWIPGFCLGSCGGMKRNDIRMAWREKVALCLIIGFLCLFLLFFIIGLRYIICPTQNVLTQDEVRALKSPRFSEKPYQAYFSAFGQYMDATDLMDSHKRAYGSGSGPNAVPNFLFESYYGEDISFLFFKADAWAYYCPGLPNPPEDWDNLDAGIDWQKRDRINPSLDKIHRNLGTNGVPQLYADNLFLYTKGLIGWSREVIKQKSSAQRVYIVLFNNVYYTSPMAASADAFAPEIKELFGPNNQGQDITKKFVQARRSNPRLYDNSLNCINNMFYIGTVDTRDTFQCRITNSLLFGASIVLVAVIGVKFLAALQFGTKTEPEQADKFVILMVPCYTEGVESLTKTLDSLSTFKYDDKRKLLMVICDGMIIGSGNDRPTPRIVLDILGVDPSEDPEPLAFQSLGEGSKQYNMGKVYSGLYEIRGHAVPFVVIVKCGSAKERVKPGNRGKRDSQLILMRFLNRVHFNAVFSPLELEMYHQMKNVIGVSPSFYEFVLMVDADTEVESSSLNRMVSIMVNDAKIIGLCGETKIANEKESWVTMIQVSFQIILGI